MPNKIFIHSFRNRIPMIIVHLITLVNDRFRIKYKNKQNKISERMGLNFTIRLWWLFENDLEYSVY